jgi:hypothetical protein
MSSAKMILKNVSKQKNRKGIFSHLSARLLEQPGLWERITGDNTWIFQYNPEEKYHCVQ